MSAGHQSDFRNSIRFPLHLRVTLKTPEGEYRAEDDGYFGGRHFASTLESNIEVGSQVEFAIEMPIDVSEPASQ